MSNISEIEKLLTDKSKVSKEVKKEEKKFDEINNFLSKENRISVELKRQIPSLCSGQTIVNCVAENDYDIIISLSKMLLKEKMTPIIVLTSLNYLSIKKLIEKANLDYNDFIIVDTVSKNIMHTSNDKNTFFVDSLSNLTQIQITLLNIIKSNKSPAIIFDSLDVFELYHNNNVISKYVYSLTKLLHKYSCCAYYLLNKNALLPLIGQFFNSHIKIEKIE
jgi:hypothetical protein